MPSFCNRVVGVLAAAAMTLPTSAWSKDIVVHAGHLIDGVTAVPREHVSILIHDERITAVKAGFESPAGFEVIDLSGSTVLPGFIDAHVHTFGTPKGDPVAERMTHSEVDNAYAALPGYKAMLHAGFTTVRNVGGDTELVVALKHAIANGEVEGPRMLVAGVALSPTGGHNDPRNGLDPALDHAGWDDAVIDGPEEAVKAVRRLHRDGADLIKIMPSGGVLSINDDPTETLMTEAEIRAVVETAHGLHMKVAAHAHGTDAINLATRLGVDSIEHGSFMDAESVRLMKAHGTYLVPTLLVASNFLELAAKNPRLMNPSSVIKVKEVAPVASANLARAYRAGVKIALGTDTEVGENGKEFALMVAAGMTSADAILAGTRNAADLLGLSKDVGTVQAGRLADLVAVNGDPLADISLLQRPAFVMKSGVPIEW